MIAKVRVSTRLQTELIDITSQVQKVVTEQKVKSGICVVWVPHTTAGITINENADPSVRRDILVELNKIIPEREYFTHSEGNSPAHIKSSVIGCEKTILVEDGHLALGTWQGVYFCEFDGPREREVWVKVIQN